MENTCFCSYADGWCASCKRKYEEEEEERAKPWQQIKQEAIEELAFTFFFFDMLKNNPDVDCSRAKAKDFWSAETYDVKLPWKDLAVGRVCHGRGRGWDSLRRNESMPEHLVDACKRCARAFIRAEFQVCFENDYLLIIVIGLAVYYIK
ncbi:transmembrane protein, putative [Medicago truncatula]|uniref:Transmembrane protein, putative n=1 Tax=Medicago truncatula TaxID=3880 RepID=G7KJC0_MEDTR|nr:transmembrane protein, putative [Medicago truncatula]